MLKLEDLLEDSPDNKHYLSTRAIKKLEKHNNKVLIEPLPLISGCIHAGYYKMGGRDQQYVMDKTGYRKLTTLECMRLMNFDDRDCFKINNLLSDTQVYKATGNSIVVKVLEYKFKEMSENMNKIRVFEAFSGIGAQHKALTRLKNKGVLDFEVVGVSDWTIDAIIAYAAIHYNIGVKMVDGEWQENLDINAPENKDELMEYLSLFTFSTDGKTPLSNEQVKRKPLKKLRQLYQANKAIKNFGSIIDIKPKELPEFDLFTYSFPCTDISQAGKQGGLDKNSGTSSSLLWECQKIIEYHRPKYLLMENVKNLVGKKHKENFDEFLSWLDNLGYDTEWEILDAKDFGVPQSRKRVFATSIRRD